MDAHDLNIWWRAGGWGMYAIALVGMPSIAVSISHAALARRGTFFAALGLLLATVVVGLGFYEWGMHVLETALPYVAVEFQDRVRRVGTEENGHMLQLLIPIAVISALPFALGELRRFSDRRRAVTLAAD